MFIKKMSISVFVIQRVSCIAVMLGLSTAIGDELPGVEAINIGSRLELFVDDYLIDEMTGVELKLHEPKAGEIALVHDTPWEGVTSHQVTVFQDDGVFRMYYRGSSHEGYTQMSKLHETETVVPPHSVATCYAESKDGIHWNRPSLGIFEFDGSKNNNIVWMENGSATFSPFKDKNPKAPASERYKAIASTKGAGRNGGGLFGLVSADGIHWSLLGGSEKLLITDGAFDSLNVVLWDDTRKQYVAFYRAYDEYDVRSIKVAFSNDFLSWSPGKWEDYGSAPRDHLYTNATVTYFRAPHYFISIPRRFIPHRTYFEGQPWDIYPGVSDAVFMSSRDAIHWHRFEEAFIRPGLDERNWSHRANTPAVGIVPTGDNEISIFVSRNYTFPSNFIERLTLRTDGFVSMHADAQGGEFVTKPIIFDGEQLVLNYSTSAKGSIQIEVQDVSGQPIPQFSLEDSPIIFGDHVEHHLKWRGPATEVRRANWHDIAGKPIKLRFVMRDADIYSFRFK